MDLRERKRLIQSGSALLIFAEFLTACRYPISLEGYLPTRTPSALPRATAAEAAKPQELQSMTTTPFRVSLVIEPDNIAQSFFATDVLGLDDLSKNIVGFALGVTEDGRAYQQLYDAEAAHGPIQFVFLCKNPSDFVRCSYSVEAGAQDFSFENYGVDPYYTGKLLNEDGAPQPISGRLYVLYMNPRSETPLLFRDIVFLTPESEVRVRGDTLDIDGGYEYAGYEENSNTPLTDNGSLITKPSRQKVVLGEGEVVAVMIETYKNQGMGIPEIVLSP